MTLITLVTGYDMPRWFTGRDDTVMTGVAGAYDRYVIYPANTVESNSVMAVFTGISAADVCW